MRIRSLAWCLALVGSPCATGCKRSTAGPATQPSPAGPARLQPQIDADRMFGVLATLASDGLNGRYSLNDEDIRRCVDVLVAQYQAAGIAPVGDDYRHEFSVVTKVRLGDMQRLRVMPPSAKAKTLPERAFVPLGLSGSGMVAGELVFVGYAARSDDETYDDLAGLDVRGKIALVLTDLPGQPSPRRWVARVREIVTEAEHTATSLRAAGDTQALAKLHLDTRKRIAALVSPYLRGQPLPPEFMEAPADPATPLVAGPFVNHLHQAFRARPGPHFPAAQGRLRSKIDRLREAGVAGVVVVRGARSFLDAQSRAADELPALTEVSPGIEVYPFPVVQVRWKVADRWLRVGGKTLSSLQTRIDTALVPRSASAGLEVELQTDVEPIVASMPNVLATLPGSDLAHEVVLLGAHYDHIGIDAEGRGDCHRIERTDGTVDAICNGADDNASGTAIVVEMARALVEANVQPRRTLVFAHFGGEEIGLLGSKALADDPPTVPPFAGGNIVAMINLDMIGRLSERGLAIGGVGSSSGWMPLFERIVPDASWIVYDRSVTTRSDHASFYKHDIPVLFFFTHLHADYHAPGDEVEHINREGMQKIAEVVAALLVAVGDGHPLPYSPPRVPEEGLVGALPGDNPATVVHRDSPKRAQARAEP